MTRLVVFTIVSNNYLAEASAWLRSVQAVHPDAIRKVVIVDDPELARSWLGKEFVVDVKEVLGVYFDDMALRYDALELNTATKPFAARHLLSKEAADRVVYVDPDIHFYNPMDDILSPMDEYASVILTPHILKPYWDDAKPSDFDFIRSGIFNLGFVALRRCEETGNFLDWWAERLTLQCFSDPDHGLFTDQKWCDLAPALLPNLHICRMQGANVAYWNLAQRGLRFEEGRWTCSDGSPLIFLHFSGFDPNKPRVLSRHEDRFASGVPEDLAVLFSDYARGLELSRWNESRTLRYAFGARGTLILSRPVRRLYARTFPKTQDADTVRKLDIEALCSEPDPTYRNFPFLRMSRLAGEILRLNPTVHPLFAVDTPLGRLRFRLWLKRFALPSYGIDASMVL